MRHLTAALIATAVLVVGAGCADTTAEQAAAGASAPAASSSPSASPAPDAKVCEDVKKVHLEYSAKVSDLLDKETNASKQGDTAGADALLAQLRAAAVEWAGKLEPIAGQAQGPELRTSLANLVAALKQYNAGNGYDNVGTTLKASREMTDTLTKFCP